MSYSIEIQLCDDDSVITKIETEVKDTEQGEELIAVLSAAMENYYRPDLS